MRDVQHVVVSFLASGAVAFVAATIASKDDRVLAWSVCVGSTCCCPLAVVVAFLYSDTVCLRRCSRSTSDNRHRLWTNFKSVIAFYS